MSLAQAQAIVDRVQDNQAVAQVLEHQGGHIGAIYEIALVHAPPLIIKLYSESLHWKMRKEVNICRMLADRLSVPVPRILLADDDKSLIELNFVVMNKLDGGVLRGLEPALAEAELFSAYEQMGQVLREIQGVSMPGFGYIGPNGIWTSHPGNRAYMSVQFESKLVEFVERGGDAALRDRLKAVVVERAYLLDACSAAHLCHYDFHSACLAQPRDGSLRLSGFSTSKARLPAILDIAKALLLHRQREPKTAGLLAGYGAVRRADWRETVSLYRLYCTLSFGAGWPRSAITQLAGLARCESSSR